MVAPPKIARVPTDGSVVPAANTVAKRDPIPGRDTALKENDISGGAVDVHFGGRPEHAYTGQPPPSNHPFVAEQQDADHRNDSEMSLTHGSRDQVTLPRLGHRGGLDPPVSVDETRPSMAIQPSSGTFTSPTPLRLPAVGSAQPSREAATAAGSRAPTVQQSGVATTSPSRAAGARRNKHKVDKGTYGPSIALDNDGYIPKFRRT